VPREIIDANDAIETSGGYNHLGGRGRERDDARWSYRADLGLARSVAAASGCH
jgi:hypothetical protein